MINDSMETNKLIGIIQPRNNQNENYINPELHNVGCLGKITNFKKTNDGRYIIELKGIIRFKIENEFSTNKKYREFEINFDNYFEDLTNKKEDLDSLI